jgi:hypothetical protein
MAEALRKKKREAAAKAIEDALARCRVEEEIAMRAELLDEEGHHGAAYDVRTAERDDRFNYREACIGGWVFDNRAFTAKWNAKVGTDASVERAKLLLLAQRQAEMHPRYNYERSRDERGEFWFRDDCKGRRTKGNLCDACIEKELRSRRELSAHSQDTNTMSYENSPRADQVTRVRSMAKEQPAKQWGKR